MRAARRKSSCRGSRSASRLSRNMSDWGVGSLVLGRIGRLRFSVLPVNQNLLEKPRPFTHARAKTQGNVAKTITTWQNRILLKPSKRLQSQPKAGFSQTTRLSVERNSKIIATFD